MKRSEFLKLVKVQVATSYRMYPYTKPYICTAIRNIDADFSKPRRERLCQCIRKLLEGHYCLERWLQYQHGIHPCDTKDYENKAHATRQAWLDWMIYELEAKGR